MASETLAIRYQGFVPTIKKADGEYLEAEERAFTLFPKLPIELRLKIWKYSLPGPRIVEFEFSRDYAILGGAITKENLGCKMACKNSSLAMLQVNSESQSVTLSKYSPQFGEVSGRPIYFSNERDILCLDYCTVNWFLGINSERDHREFQRSLGLVQNVVVNGWGYYAAAALKCRVGSLFDDLHNLGLVKPTSKQTTRESEIMPFLIKQMEKRKKEGSMGIAQGHSMQPSSTLRLAQSDIWLCENTLELLK